LWKDKILVSERLPDNESAADEVEEDIRKMIKEWAEVSVRGRTLVLAPVHYLEAFSQSTCKMEVHYQQ
jgi:hypothetical protein